ncbi:cation-translocating P-type ATPase [Gordonia amicalis]|uniref:cation-translocating P-type ATPase n=1 Tax=Gordonia amicalis TaxID=89053 RepID=UPI002952C3A1|nr:cation-translocating P-type ATPase [Gordonia amicalis]MDV7174927.1 cation-translocating P-type ATPase [Gordonia amicalis]
MGLFHIPLQVTHFAVGAALISGEAAVGTTRGVAGLARTAAGLVAESFAGPPVRRSSSHGDNRWIEVRGLDGSAAHTIGTTIVADLLNTPGVRDAVLNEALSRVVVTVESNGPTVEELVEVVEQAESRVAASPDAPRRPSASLPGDDTALAARLLSAYAAGTGLILATGAAALRVTGVTSALAAPVSMAQNSPSIRRRVEARFGPDAAQVFFSALGAGMSVLTVSPGALLADSAVQALLVAETINARRNWERFEPELTRQAFKSAGLMGVSPRAAHRSVGAADSYADRSTLAGIGAAAISGIASGKTATAGSAALALVPKPVRSIRESFGVALGRGLMLHHRTVVMRPDALRSLEAVTTVLIDPRVLFTDELTVTRIEGVPPEVRSTAWSAAREALHEGLLAPGWHKLSDIPGAGGDGEALISALRDPFASAVVTESRRVGIRVISLDHDGLRSLGQGFDDLLPTDDGIDRELARALTQLHADGRQVLLVTGSTESATLPAEVVVGVWQDNSIPPWGADLLVPDLRAVWRILHAVPAAKKSATKGIELSASASVIGAVMLLPEVVGNGPTSVNMTAVGALWSGYRLADGVFDDPLPHPEPGHDWHALPVEEVRALLPRPEPRTTKTAGTDERRFPGFLAPVTGPLAATWRIVGEYFEAFREDLDEPITPILATGALATALLGSPFDAVLVASVLLVNAATSTQQSLHAEKVLGGLLAAQEPLAHRVTGATDDADVERVPAGDLQPGDLIRVGPGKVIPADARIIVADGAEVDESALTGESLPVSKATDPTPGAPLADRTGMLHAGTTMVAGRAVAVVTTVGAGTQMNRASAMTARKARKVGLQAQLAHITGRALPWSIAGGVAVGVLSLLRGTPVRQSAGTGVAIAAAAVPEGLPLVVTLAQLATARQLTSDDVLVRNPRAVEAFARLDIVCFDKTGTLSENHLRVVAHRGVSGVADDDVLAAAARTVKATVGKVEHATDEAIHVAAQERGMTLDDADAHLPFQSDRPYAAALVGTTLSIKGAPEILGARLTVVDDGLDGLIEEMAASGLRVLAVAGRELTSEQAAAARDDQSALEALCDRDLIPVGAIGIADTPRPSARPLLAELRRRGIGVRLITGDHPLTAAVAARDLGLPVTLDDVMTGPVWDSLTADARIDAVQRFQVFARMAPEHKVQVVEALEAADLVSAMVGDGANDAAAIRAATVGVGLIATGSDPASTAADVLLLDGQIGALITAIDEGHQLWRRVHAAVSMLVGHNLGEVTFSLITSAVTGRPAMSARQILLVNMLTDAFPAAALAVSPQVAGGLADFDEAALWRATYTHCVSTVTGATLAWLLARPIGTQRRAATVGLAGLVLTQVAEIVSESHGPLVVATSIGTFAVLVGVISTPGVSQLFGCRPLGPIGWGQAAVGAGAAMAVSRVAPTVTVKLGEWYRGTFGSAAAEGGVDEQGSGVDDEYTGTHQQGIEPADGRGQNPDTGRDEAVGVKRPGDLSHVGKPNRRALGQAMEHSRLESEMLTSVKSFVDSHRDVSKLVEEAESFSIQLPVVGRVGVPPPEKLAFYGALGLLAAVEIIDWPVAVALGIGHAVTTGQLEHRAEKAEHHVREVVDEAVEEAVEEAFEEATEQHALPAAPAATAKAPARKAAPRKSAPKKTGTTKTATRAGATKAPAKKTAAKKTAARKTTAKKTPTKKVAPKKPSNG